MAIRCTSVVSTTDILAPTTPLTSSLSLLLQHPHYHYFSPCSVPSLFHFLSSIHHLFQFRWCEWRYQNPCNRSPQGSRCIVWLSGPCSRCHSMQYVQHKSIQMYWTSKLVPFQIINIGVRFSLDLGYFLFPFSHLFSHLFSPLNDSASLPYNLYIPHWWIRTPFPLFPSSIHTIYHHVRWLPMYITNINLLEKISRSNNWECGGTD